MMTEHFHSPTPTPAEQVQLQLLFVRHEAVAVALRAARRGDSRFFCRVQLEQNTLNSTESPIGAVDEMPVVTTTGIQ